MRASFRLSVVMVVLSIEFLPGSLWATGDLFDNCPAEGKPKGAKSRMDPDLNSLKNRQTMPASFETVKFADLANLSVPAGESKAPMKSWSADALQAVQEQEKRAIAVEGYLLGVKQEGPESPNCYLANAKDHDFHVWLAASPTDTRAAAVVVEVTPRIRAQHPAWSVKNLQRFVSQKSQMRISGWILLDPEHPDQVGKTRQTIWEIHPIMKIEVFSGGKWVDLDGSASPPKAAGKTH